MSLFFIVFYCFLGVLFGVCSVTLRENGTLQPIYRTTTEGIPKKTMVFDVISCEMVMRVYYKIRNCEKPPLTVRIN